MNKADPLVGLISGSLQQGYQSSQTLCMGAGCTLPLAEKLEAATGGGKVLMIGIEDPSSRSHGPDESLDLDVFRGNRDGLIAFMIALGQATPEKK